MTICQFFLRGQCRFGEDCRNEHPEDAQRHSGFGTSSWTNPSRTMSSTAEGKVSLPFSPDTITNDLTPSKDKPIWPLTSFGPAKHEPLLLSGLDESPEELRVRAVAAIQAGNVNEYLLYEASKIASAEQVFVNALTNVKQAYEKAVSQSSIPAMLSVSSLSTQPSTGSGFGSGTSAFGGAGVSAFAGSTSPSAFGTSSFGAPVNVSAFGTQKLTSTFGAPLPSTSAFSNPSSSTTASAFGTPSVTTVPTSAFGLPAVTTSVFGKPSFGQPAFGQTATPSGLAPNKDSSNPPTTSSVFGQPTTVQSTTSAFNQTSTPPSSLIKPASGAFSAFAGSGNSTFGSGSGTGVASGGGGGAFSAFSGQPSAFGLAAASGNSSDAGAAQLQTSGSVFGQSSFGQPSTSGSLFGQVQAPAGVTGGFSAFIPAASTPGSQFGTPPASFSQSSTTTTSNLSAFQNQSPLSAQQKAQSGPPDFRSARAKATYKPGSTPYDSQIPAKYKEMLPKDVLAAFESTRFEFGQVPEWVPPLEMR